MSIHVACPHCRKEYDLASQFAGKRVRCQACRETFPVAADTAVRAGTTGAQPAVPAAIEEDYPEAELADEDEVAAPPRKSKVWLFVLLGGGLAAFLLFGVVV